MEQFAEKQIRAMDDEKLGDLAEIGNRLARLSEFIRGAGMAISEGGDEPVWSKEAQIELAGVRPLLEDARMHLEERIKELAQK